MTGSSDHVQAFAGEALVPQQRDERCADLIVRVGDAEHLAVVERAAVVMILQAPSTASHAAHLAAGDDVPRLVAAQDWLDAQYCADQRRRARNAAAAL